MIGIVLSGGRASRIGGGDKGRLSVAGRSLVERAIATLRRQCGAVVLNANGDPARFSDLGLPVIADATSDQPGPLAGILAGLDYAAHAATSIGFVVTVPVDTPFVPGDLVGRLEDARAADNAAIAYACSAGVPHPVVALWAVGLRDDLRMTLARPGPRGVRTFIERHAYTTVDWPVASYDPFFNVNTLDDLAAAEEMALRFGL